MAEPDALVSQLLDSWRINHRLNLYFLANLSPEQLLQKSPKSKNVAGHFAHQHNVRLMWLKAAAPELMSGLEKLEEGADSEALNAAHIASAQAMETLLEQAFAAGKVKNFKPHPAAFLGYLLAHDAYHRSQAELVLRQSNTPIPDKIAYGLWEWGSR